MQYMVMRIIIYFQCNTEFVTWWSWYAVCCVSL